MVNAEKMYYVNKDSSDTTLRIELDFTAKKEGLGNLYYVSDGKIKSADIMSHNGNSKYVIELNESNIEYFWLNLMEYKSGDTIAGTVSYSLVSKEDNYINYEKAVEKLQQEEFKIEAFSDEWIIGNVNLSSDRIMCFTIPYSKEWNIYIDGQKTDTWKVNEGFIGCYAEKGTHYIEIRYAR